LYPRQGPFVKAGSAIKKRLPESSGGSPKVAATTITVAGA
jgi:hypothetical protein